MAENINRQPPMESDVIRASHFDNALNGLAYCQMIFDALGHPEDYLYLETNKSFEKLTGLEAVAGKRASQLSPDMKASNSMMLEVFGRVSLTRKPESFETYMAPIDRWFLISVYSPQKNYFVASLLDITDRKQTEKDLENAKIAARNVLEDLEEEKEMLAENNAKDEALLESIGDGVVATDQSGKVILINKAAEGLLGFASSEIIGKMYENEVVMEDVLGNRVPHEARPIRLALTMGISTNTTSTASSYFFVRKNGVSFPVAISVTPVILNKKTIGGVIVFRDISKEKEIEHAKSEFISIASHQLRTPISGLSWLTEALQSNWKGMDAKQKKYVDDLSTLSKRLVELIEDLLDFSKIELKTGEVMEKDTIEICDFIDEFLKEMKSYADSKRHVLVFHKNVTKPCIVEINKKSLYNVLENIVSNAVDYSPRDPEVAINLDKIGNFIKISVTNKGPSIPEEDIPNIFEKFYRGKTAKKMKAEGTGLGLYIVKAIIEGIGGNVGFESKEGVGTTFWFTLPLQKNN